jgi:hypothetical protein
MAHAREGKTMDLIWRRFTKPPMTIYRAQEWDEAHKTGLNGRSYTIVGDGIADWAVAFADPPNVQRVGTAPQINDAKRLAQSHFAALLGG